MPTVQEMQLLNGSLDDLSRVLMQNKLMQQTERERLSREMLARDLQASQQGFQRGESAAERKSRAKLQQQEIGARRDLQAGEQGFRADQNEQDRMSRELMNEQDVSVRKGQTSEMAAYRKQVLESEQGRQSLNQLQQAHEQLSRNVAIGAMTPEQADAAAKRLVESIRNSTDIILKQSPFAAMMDSQGGSIFSAGPKAQEKPTVTLKETLGDVGTVERNLTPSEWAQDHRNPKNAPPTVTLPLEAKTRLDEIDQEILKHEMNLAKGDTRYGFGNIYSRQNRIKELQDEKQKLGAIGKPAAQSPGRPQPKSGSITNDFQGFMSDNFKAPTEAPGNPPPASGSITNDLRGFSQDNYVFPDEATARAAGFKAGDIITLTVNGVPKKVRLR